jgi:tight adherence protein B
MSRATLRACVAVALTAALLINSSAAMASTGKIVQLLPDGRNLDIVFQATDLPEGVDIDPASVRVSVGGQTVTSTAKPVAVSEKPVQRTAVLAFDNSRSMAGAKLEAAKAAAILFIEKLPPDVAVGLVTFNNGTQVVSPPTPDRTALMKLIKGLTIADTVGTALYAGAVVAMEQAGTEGTRSVLMLTDGKPGKADAIRQESIAKVTEAEVRFDAVYIGPDPTPPAQLGELVSGGSGEVLKSDPAALSSVFERAAQAISSQLQISVKVPAALAGKPSTITVNATAADESLVDSAFVTLAKAPARPVDAGQFGPRAVKPGTAATLVSDPLLPVALAVLFLGMLALGSVGFAAAGGGQNRSTRLRRRLSIYTVTGRQASLKRQESTRLGSSNVARSAVDLAGRVVQQRDFEAAVGERLEAAGVPLRAAEWTLIHVGVALLFPLLLLLLSGGAILPTLVGLVLGLALPWLYLSFKESRRTSAFLTQLPDTLQMVAGSLSAGYSVPQALDTVVREGQQPITGEFNRALVETRLGVPIEQALEGVASRMKSRDFEWVVMAIRIQREVGGNLAEVLTTVAGTLRERERLRRQVQVLSAEGRLSAWILGALPPVFALYLILSKPDYLRPLVTQPLGWVLVGTGITLLTVGVLWMRQAVKVEV